MNADTRQSDINGGARKSLLSSDGRGWNGFGAELFGISAGTHHIAPIERHRIGVHMGKPVRAHCVCDGDGRRYTRIQAHGDADIIPAGVGGMWSDEDDCTVLRIWFEDAFARAIHEQLDLKPSEARIEPRLHVRDARLQHLAWALHAELEAEEASDSLYAESLCTAMLVRMLSTAPALEGRRHTLAPKAAARLTDHIESSLDQPLTLVELASLLHISVPHFKVLFRETFGLPVHQYIVRRRVERAKALLQTGKVSAAQVALDVGFSHQSHMARWMNRLLGVGPSEIMKSR
ncbi:MAG TPA: AraC family transcriptional regulator [Trinickia sp.]|nr:AraC family transcriptional regulator [Trinickia sp.]